MPALWRGGCCPEVRAHHPPALPPAPACLPIASPPHLLTSTRQEAAEPGSVHRALRDEPRACTGFETVDCRVLKPERRYLLVFVALGLVYLFVGIAIVCDELFVPALEVSCRAKRAS